jgi:hypothetical protein
MRHVLRRIGTDGFMKSVSQDTEHSKNGRAFSGFSEALDFCVKSDLKGVELVLLDDQGEEQVCITLI